MAEAPTMTAAQKRALVNLAWVGDREGAAVHATNPPPEGKKHTTLCKATLKSDLTVEMGTLGDVSCSKCLGTLDLG